MNDLLNKVCGLLPTRGTPWGVLFDADNAAICKTASPQTYGLRAAAELARDLLVEHSRGR